MKKKKLKKKMMTNRSQSSGYLSRLFVAVLLFQFGCSSPAGNSTPATGNSDSLPSEIIAINAEIANSPSDPELIYRRSKLWADKKQFDKALEDIDKATQLDSTNPLYHFRGGEYLFALNFSQRSAAAFEQAVKYNPNYTDAWQKLGELYLLVKEYEKSEKCWKALLRIDKNNSHAAFFRGIMYKEMGDTTKAVQAFQFATELDPKYIEPQMQLGSIFSAKNNPLCVRYFQNVIDVNPKLAEAYMARGDFYRRAGKYGEAIKDFDQTLTLQPTNYLANYNAGVIFVMQKKWKAAAKQFTEVIDKNQGYTYAYFSRANCYQYLGEIGNAREDLKKCLELDPKFPEAEKMLKGLAK
ncbi:MAG: tetratricopeptide repeat protein [Flavobacteriaceae bacterium]|nr:tetratricopeptide repeat protein [Flavobacteriaceae bacterium]